MVKIRMLNKLWAGMILLGVLWAGFHGTMDQVTEQILSSAEAAVQLCITMLGIVSMWTGIMKIAERAGILDLLTGLLHPFLRWMFPRIPKEHPAMAAIGVNIVANILGLGWAATPAGLKAMEELGKLQKERGQSGKKGIASNEMCVFLILNISALQLIPVNMIAYRSQYGSVSPTMIVGPALIVTTICNIAGIIFCKIMDRK